MPLFSNYRFIGLRNHIITLLSLANANRSGVLTEMTLDDYRHGQYVDGFRVVSVVNHKTVSTHGAANICVSPMEEDLIAGYLLLRANIDLANTNNRFFVTISGGPMSQSNIAYAISSSFKSSGAVENISVSNTKIRKFAVTLTYAKQPSLKNKLSSMMCHSSNTAEKYYLHDEKEKNTVVMSNYLRSQTSKGKVSSRNTVRAARQKSSVKADKAGDVESSGEEAEVYNAESSNSETQLSDAVALNIESSSTCDTDDKMHLENHRQVATVSHEDGSDLIMQDMNTILVENKHEKFDVKKRIIKRLMSADDEISLRHLFRDLIDRDYVPMKTVKTRLESNQRLLEYLQKQLNDEGNSFFKRIVDKLRNMSKKQRRHTGVERLVD